MTPIAPGALTLLTLLSLPATLSAAESICYGTTAKGALEDGCKLPSGGANFSSYTSLGALLGRTWVHCTVAEIVNSSFATLNSSHPTKHFVSGETGRVEGGQFKPHKTHQNGLSVDFMVPVVNKLGKSVPLPTGFTNKFGYEIEFDAKGNYNDLSIDFEAMAAHIAAVRTASSKAGAGIWRIIFDPKLQPKLHATESWPAIKDLKFSTKRSWVRHDEHYHIDFNIPCKPMSELGR